MKWKKKIVHFQKKLVDLQIFNYTFPCTMIQSQFVPCFNVYHKRFWGFLQWSTISHFRTALSLKERTQEVSIFLGRRFHGTLNTCPSHLRWRLRINKTIGSNNKLSKRWVVLMWRIFVCSLVMLHILLTHWWWKFLSLHRRRSVRHQDSVP